MPMRFSWDERKRRLNLKEHGLDFVDAPRVFEGSTFTFEDDRFAYDEQRFVTLGFLAGMVVFHGSHRIAVADPRDLFSKGDAK